MSWSPTLPIGTVLEGGVGAQLDTGSGGRGLLEQNV